MRPSVLSVPRTLFFFFKEKGILQNTGCAEFVSLEGKGSACKQPKLQEGSLEALPAEQDNGKKTGEGCMRRIPGNI